MIERGNKKWNSIMMPELVHALQKIEEEEESNISKPYLAEDQLVEIERNIKEAIYFNKMVNVEYFENKHSPGRR